MSKRKTAVVSTDTADPALRREIGGRLKSIRELLGLTQTEIAERTGFSHGYISRVESGERIASVELAMALRVRLNVNDRYLLYGEGPAIERERGPDWSDLDRIVADLVDVANRLEAWRHATEPGAGAPIVKSNARISGTAGGSFTLSEIREALESLEKQKGAA